MNLPKIAIWSIFRDDAGNNIKLYRERIEALDYPRHLIRLYLAEGDSVDNTFGELVEWSKQDNRVNITKANSSLPRYGHTTEPLRFHSLAVASNAAIDMIAEDDWANLAVLIESDLLYESNLLLQLYLSKPPGKSVISPMVWLRTPDSYRFYDIWAFRTPMGEHFPLATGDWYSQNYPHEIFEIESSGSVVMFEMEVIRAGCRYDGDVIRGMCLQARERGYRIYVDPNTCYHYAKQCAIIHLEGLKAENLSLLEMATLHMDSRAVMVLNHRLSHLNHLRQAIENL